MKRETKFDFGRALAFGAITAALVGCGGGGGGGGGSSVAGGFPSGIYIAGGTSFLYQLTSLALDGWSEYSMPGRQAVAFDSKKRAYEIDNSRIVMIDHPGAAPVGLGTLGIGQGQFSSQIGDIQIGPNDTIYVLDIGNKRVVRMSDMTGSNWTTLDLNPEVPSVDYDFFRMAISKTGEIYLTQSQQSRIAKYDSIGDTTPTYFGNWGVGPGLFTTPDGICIDKQGRIYVTQESNTDPRIVRFDDLSGANWVEYGQKGSGPGQFLDPTAVATDADGRIYVLDTANARVSRIDDMSGANWAAYGQAGNDPGQFAGSLFSLKIN